MVNDRHPSGVPSPGDSASGFSYGTFDAAHGQSEYGAPDGADAYAGYATANDAYAGASWEGTAVWNSGGYDTGAYDAGAWTTGSFDTSASWDPSSWDTGGYGTAAYGTDVRGSAAYADGYGSDPYGQAAYDTGSHGHVGPGAHVPDGSSPERSLGGCPAPDDGTGQWTFGVQDTGAWGTGAWGVQDGSGTHDGYAPNGYQQQHAPTAYGYGGYGTDGYNTDGYTTDGYGTDAYGADGYGLDGYAGLPESQGAFADGRTGLPDGTAGFAAGGHATEGDQHGYGPEGFAPGTAAHASPAPQEATGQWSFATQHEYDTADTWGFPDPDAHSATPHDSAAPAGRPVDTSGHGAGDTAEFAAVTADLQDDFPARFPEFPGSEARSDARAAESTEHFDAAADSADTEDAEDAAPLSPLAPSSRGRRRSPKPRRRALLTVAVPSVAVMGVAGAAAATVLGGGGDDEKVTTASDAQGDAGAPVKPSAANSKLDSQLSGVSANASDFRDRASRTQERIDLKERQKAEKERKAKEAARKEAMRPKFVLPVKDHTLSARYGQAGVNWMSVHTGIDFPVSYGTSVHAATDGTVSTKYDMSYGNMAIVTAKDGTQTWYCHLSSTKIRSGEVKAGDTIAYSGSSGNSTGPHLHFEVRPGGGSAVDPIPWLQDKGLDIS